MLFDALEIGEPFCFTKARKEKVHSTPVSPASQEKVLVLFCFWLSSVCEITLFFFKYNFISFSEFEIKKTKKTFGIMAVFPCGFLYVRY